MIRSAVHILPEVTDNAELVKSSQGHILTTGDRVYCNIITLAIDQRSNHNHPRIASGIGLELYLKSIAIYYALHH